MKYLLSILLILVVLFGLPALGLFNLTFWSPKYQEAQRNVYENTKSYNHGTIRDIQNLVLEYQKATDEGHKQALRSTIQHRLASFDVRELPIQLQKTIEKEIY